jgi:hypothetical protein
MFDLTEEQCKKVAEWVAEIDPPREDGMPKHGAIGGALTYQFTPTSVGTVTKAVFLIGTDHEQSLDLSDYTDW